jgi:hypothetical protein
MKSICITGANAPDLQQVAHALQVAGMQPPKPAKPESPADLAFWHEQVVAAAVEEGEGLQAFGNLGRLWEQMAADIFVANIKSKIWGWADTRSTWLLDFWLQFEPRLNFVLVVTSPQHMLARAIAADGAFDSVDDTMAAWQVHHQELLRFYHRNPQRCLLVDTQDCADHPSALVQRCNAQWKLALSPLAQAPQPTTQPAKQPEPPSAISQFLAHQLSQGYPEATSLQHEITATVSRLGSVPTSLTLSVPTLDPLDMVGEYRALRSARDEQAQLAQEHLAELTMLETQCDQLTQENAKLIADCAASTGARDQLALQHKAAIAQALAERESEAKAKQDAIAQREAATRQLADTKQESELLLLQLHQVQEELETYFLKHQEMERAKDQLASERDAASKAKAEAITQRDAETKAKKSALAQRDAQVAENAQLVAAREAQGKLAIERQTALTALQTQTNVLAKDKSKLVADCAELVKAKDQLTSQRDAETKAKAAAISQRDAEAKAKQDAFAQRDTVSRQLKEAQQEGELLLSQLHQVQEELEHYFLQHQDAQRRVADADQRWARMLQRTPAYCDYDAIEIIGAESTEGDGPAASSTQWHIKNLTTAGRNLPQLEFTTVVENGLAGYVISRQAGTAGPLTRWPATAADQTELNLAFNGTPEHATQTLANLQDLASADWDLLQTLGKLLTAALDDNPTALNGPDNFKPDTLRTGLGKLAQIFEKFPPTLRFDTASLKREQVNPDYEHLWLRLSNLAFAGKRWPEFEFRLSCANVRPKKFGTHPKLEFPEHIGQAPFSAWFDESFDDFGAKLELRFALPDAMDTAVWQKLSEADHAFLQALIARLPAILATLEAAGTQLRRPWADWTAMAVEVQRVLALRIAALNAVAAPPTPAPEHPPAPVLALVPAKPKAAPKPAAAPKIRKAK